MLNLRIATTGIAMSFLLVIAATVIVAYTLTSSEKISSVDERWQDFDANGARKVDALQALEKAIGYGGLIHQFKNYVLRLNSSQADKVREKARAARKALADYRALRISPVEAAALDVVETRMVDAYLEMLPRISEAIIRGSGPEAIDALAKIDDGPAIAALDELAGAVHTEIAEQTRSVHGALEDIQTFNRDSSFLVVGILLLMVATGFWFSINRLWRPLRRILREMNALAGGDVDVDVRIDRDDEIGDLGKALLVFRDNAREKARLEVEREAAARQAENEKRAAVAELVARLRWSIDAVARGDLSQRVEIGDDDEELGKLGDDLNQMSSNLGDMASQVRDANNRIGVALSQVRSALATQSAGASEQAASVNETMATLEEIRATSNQTLDQAAQLGQVAEQSRQQSEQGRRSVEEAVDGMGVIREKVEVVARAILDLSKKTQQIGEITEVVDDLAKQSKMLALNASIEAAKAGEAGQGFAVVADEIRNLAEQSQESTAQVKGILQDILDSTERTVMATEEGTKQVEVGARLVSVAGNSMDELGEVVRRTAAGSQQIVAVVRQEAVGIDQITAAMSDINTVAGSAVSAVRQTEQAMDDLHGVAKELQDRISIYQL